MNVENAYVQMRKGILEFCVLHVIARGEVYTSDLIQELTQAKMVVVEGTLYPLLNRLKTAGLLQYSWRESTGGPPRKYYSLTPQGEENLKVLTDAWRETVASVESIIRHSQEAGFTPPAPDTTNGETPGGTPTTDPETLTES